jgi:Transposase IS116/IS110/IS902 family
VLAGVGPLTALAFVLIIGTWERFPRGKQIGNYVANVPQALFASTGVLTNVLNSPP